MEVLADDPRIGGIGLYLEAIPDVVAFARAAITCADKGVPLVAIKSGRSQAGARTALAHTSSLSGADALIDAYLRRYGVVRVDNLADLLETLKLLFVLGPVPGRRIASLSCSVAMPRWLPIWQGLSGSVAALPAEARTELTEVLGPRVAVANPLDITRTSGAIRSMRRCFAAMAGAGFDVTLLVLDYPCPKRTRPTPGTSPPIPSSVRCRKSARAASSFPRCPRACRAWRPNVSPRRGLHPCKV